MLSFKRFYVVVILILFITFSALYYSSLHNSYRIYPIKLNKAQKEAIHKLSIQPSNLFYNNDYSVYRLELSKNKIIDGDVIEIEENNIQMASLIIKSGSRISFKSWNRYNSKSEFNLNTKPYFKINSSISGKNVYLIIAEDTFENLTLKQFDYTTFAKSKSSLFLIRIIDIMILLGIILATLYIYLELKNGYSFFLLFYMVLSLCSSMLYNGFTNDFWPFNHPYFSEHSLSLDLGIHLIILSIFSVYYLKGKLVNKGIFLLSIIFLFISMCFFIASFFFTSYLLLRYEVWFSLLISLVFLFSYPTIFKAYKTKDAYWFNYFSILSYVLLSLIYSIKYFSFFTPSILFEVLQKNLFLSHISCLFFAFILINKRKLLYGLINENEFKQIEIITNFDESNNGLSQLSDREYKVLELIADGLKDQEIAEHLFVTLATVKTHKQRIYRKLNINSKLQASHIYSKFNSKAINF